VSARGDLQKLIKAIRKQGFSVEQTRSGHYEVRKINADGTIGARIATLAGTSGGGRGHANGIAELARAGFVWRNR
jgi:hypothetical protein